MSKSIHGKIREKISDMPEGSVFVLSDFSDIADSKTVSKTLTRLCSAGIIDKVMRGVFWKPFAFSSEDDDRILLDLSDEYSGDIEVEFVDGDEGMPVPAAASPVFEAPVPDPDKVARALARNNLWNIVPSGYTARHLMGIDPERPEVWTYITEKHDYQGKADDAEASLREVMELNDRVQAFAAPHDGYIAELCVKEGDVWDGSQPLYAVTAADKLPVLRADVSALERAVTEGMTATLNANSYDAIETTVIAVGTDAEGKAYADVELTDEIIRSRGSVYGMLQEETPLTLTYRSREAATLLPTNAVRGSGEDRYVYVVEQNTAAFGGNTLKLHKMSVKVVGEYGGITALQEDLSYYTIAYGEDRAIDDGDVVMEYLK